MANQSNTSIAHPMLSYQAEYSLACTYALRNPALARTCAQAAHAAALAMRNPALAYQANALLCAIGK